VPAHSQMMYSDGGEAWCSPVSLSMVMAYWADRTGKKNLDQPIPTVVRGSYDYAYGGNGNWLLNTAYASSLGFDASVRRFSTLEEVERCLAAGVPIVASIAWKRDELSGRPIPESEGHLFVIRGFDRSGDIVVRSGRPRRLACQAYLPPRRVRSGLALLWLRRSRLPRLPGWLCAVDAVRGAGREGGVVAPGCILPL
jgi:hypothetical protein